MLSGLGERRAAMIETDLARLGGMALAACALAALPAAADKWLNLGIGGGVWRGPAMGN
jgi:hypothetical protein